MPQVFSKSQVLLVRLIIIGGIGIIVAWITIWKNTIGYAAKLEEPITQPIPFSHKHHVGDDGIDCRYCHTSVEVSATAGMPSTEICMTCHSKLFTEAPLLQPVVKSFVDQKPIAWTRVYDLPDFVYFNHSIHVYKGIGCVTCHGRVDTMPLISRQTSLNMQWCLDCHRNPHKYIRPREEVFNLDWKPSYNQLELGFKLLDLYKVQLGKITDCSICHR